MASAINKLWVKRNGDSDSSMGSLDGCELCEYVRIFLLSKKKDDEGLINANVALYCDDLIFDTVKNGFKVNQIKSRITKKFRDKMHENVRLERGF